MRLLIYSHFFAPSVGGVETVVSSLARGLSEGSDGGDPFEVTLVTNTPRLGHDDSIYPFKVVRSPGLSALIELMTHCDLIHVAGPAILPLAIAWLLGKPRVIEHHGYQAICPNGILLESPQRSLCPGHFQAGRYRRCLRCEHVNKSTVGSILSLAMMVPRHFLARKATANIGITDHVLLRHHLPSAALIYHGVDDRSAKVEPAGEPALGAQFCFAFVGRFVPEKGVMVLLRAADILKRQGLTFQVKLIGDGPDRTQIESFIASQQLADCVQLTGSLRGTALEDALKEAQALAMPSVWEEAAGLSAIEQMMRGRLVIASAIGGLGEVVGEAGLLCTPGDPVALAAQMKLAMQDAGLTTELGRRAQLRARELFSRERMIREHARLYRKIAASPS